MATKSAAGFEELPHTADWALRVWAPDLPGLFAESARGMNALAGVQLARGPETKRTFAAEAPDPENLLVAFLSELVYLCEQENLAFDRFEISLRNNRLQVGMTGAPLRALTKGIKAVTYHNLRIRKTRRGFEVEIVFDV